jgi:hypothetical protein
MIRRATVPVAGSTLSPLSSPKALPLEFSFLTRHQSSAHGRSSYLWQPEQPVALSTFLIIRKVISLTDWNSDIEVYGSYRDYCKPQSYGVVPDCQC